MKKILSSFTFISFLFAVNTLHAQDKSTVAINYMKNHPEIFHLNTNDVTDIRLIDQSTDPGTGITHVYLSQFYKGVTIYNAVAGIHVNANNEVIAYNSSFQNNIEKKVKNVIPSLTANTSTSKAFQHLNISTKENFQEMTNDFNIPLKPNEHRFAKGNIALHDILSQLMLLPSEKTGMIDLVWKVNIYKSDAREWWDVFVDANSGQIIKKNNSVLSCNFTPYAQTDSFLNKSPDLNLLSPDATNDFNVVTRPSEAPSFASRTVINSPWNLAPAAASPFGWLNDGTTTYTYTRGNNVWAYLDVSNNNTAIVGNSASGGASSDFNFAINFASAPSTYTNAATTQLFYATNTMHDIWYNYGFDEASRNFQKNNNGKGGVGNDFLDAESQDSRNLTPCVRDNANMASGADGLSPRMQMYIWSAPANVRVNAPVSIASNYIAADPLPSPNGFGPCLANTNVTANVVLADTLDACSALKNGSAISGKIALLYRGTCSFVIKVKNAQTAGAVGVIIINNVPGSPINMSGTDATITIPTVMVSDVDGATIKNALGTSTVNATLNTSAPELDGDLDNGIIFHEYGHGITHRLTGNGSTCMNNAERGDEGWSDWYALVLTQKPGDNGNTLRPLGTYVVYESPTSGGIRQYPYTYNMAINPHTYSDVHTSGGEVHDIGEVWCSALWDMYWLMISKYGYDPNIYTGTGGNNKAMKLVIDGLKLQVCSPGFLDSRDAILKADTIDNAAANSCIIWSAFARRGMGYSAIQGSSASTDDQTAAFDLPPTCSAVVLPISFLSLKATPLDNKINISWKTGIEYNNSGFEIQRKSSLTEPFITIATITPKGVNGNGADYSFDDLNVSANITYYYQIVETDNDGKKNYSQVVLATIHKDITSNVVVYPNPAGKTAFLEFGSGFSNLVSVKITDVFGRMMYNKELKNISNSKVELDISNYAAGLYQINIIDKNKNVVLRVIKN